jgi:hypothetical protein
VDDIDRNWWTVSSGISGRFHRIAQLRQHLFKALPSVPDFNVELNTITCSAEDVPGDKHPIEMEIESIGTVTGYYKIASRRQRQPGISIRVRKRLVTEPSLFGLEKRGHFSFANERIVGEVNADFLDPLINTSRDDFLEDSETVQLLNTDMHDLLQSIVKGIETNAESERSESILSRPSIKEPLDELPTNVRGTARKVISAVVSKLKSVDDPEAEELVNWIIRYFESNVLRELMKSIVGSDVDDIERLSNLIQDWGLRQINSVTALIRDQIEIIEKLEELVITDKTLEIELHKLIESNLWLIREGFELWASDKPLTTLLDGHIDQLYKDSQEIRPDIVCRSRDEGLQAIILEFKRPSETISMDHITQALKYKGLISKNRPNISIETYVVGRKFNSDVLASKEDLEKANLNIWGFEEILQRSRIRFESILEILER